ncbi:MAG: nucleoside triphosphate pyrophosphohydrolase, partial [Candidatus Xenobia bacterium]
QTHHTLVPYLVEEAYEVVEAIEANRPPSLREELGDLLLQIVFHAQIAREAGEFTIDDVCRGIVDKMVRRHPHVFGDARVETAEDVVVQWEQIKLQEKGGSRPRTSLLDGIPGHLPALLAAERVQSRAAEVGFDWDSVTGSGGASREAGAASRTDLDTVNRVAFRDSGAVSSAIAKVAEEVEELAAAQDAEQRLSELGDVLFSVVALGRHLHLSGEEALRAATRRFSERFRIVERLAEAQGKSLSACSKAELADLWQQAKQQGGQACA